MHFVTRTVIEKYDTVWIAAVHSTLASSWSQSKLLAELQRGQMRNDPSFDYEFWQHDINLRAKRQAALNHGRPVWHV